MKCAESALAILSDRLLDGEVGELSAKGITVANVALYPWLRIGSRLGLTSGSAIEVAICERIERTRGFVDDLEAYPENSFPGRGRSLYE